MRCVTPLLLQLSATEKTPNVSNSDCYLFRHLQTGLKSSGCFSGQVYYLQFIVKGNGVFIMTRNKMKAH